MLEPFRAIVLEAGLLFDVIDAASAKNVLPLSDDMRAVCRGYSRLQSLQNSLDRWAVLRRLRVLCITTESRVLGHEASHPVLSSSRQPCSCHVRGLLHPHVLSHYFWQNRIFAASRMCLHCAHYMHPDTNNGARQFISLSMSWVTLD